MNVLLIGATGATGKDLLELLLKDDKISRVDVFVRRDLDVKHDKIRIHMIDFDRPEQWKLRVQGDVLFSCLGTTLQAAGSKEAQWKIDYEYQYQFAKAAHENNVGSYVLVSTANASSSSPFFYAKMKGQLEEAVRALNFSRLIIFNPPLLIREKSDRKMEVFGAKLILFFNSLGILHSQKPISTKLLSKAMLKSVQVLGSGSHAIKGQNILKYT